MTLLLRSFVRARDVERVATLELRVARATTVAALATECDGRPAPTEAALREHEAITAGVHALVPSLPSRFGVTFADATELEAALAGREEELAGALDRVDGRVEMAVTLAWRSARSRASGPALTGRAYLEARAVRERERQEAERLVARFIGELGHERAFTRESICPRAGVAATVALLIPRGEVMRVRRDITSVGERTSDVVVDVYGPFAPYSFAS